MMVITENIFNRSLFTILSNSFRSLFNLIASIFLARMLGPELFGLMSFVLASFIALKSLIDFGLSSAFYTFISESNNIYRYLTTYAYILFFQLVIPLVLIFIFMPNSWFQIIWTDVETLQIFFGYLAIFFQYYIWNFSLSLAESIRKTFLAQSIWLSISITNLIALIILWLYDLLIINNVFLLIIFEFFIGALLLFFLIKKQINFEFKKESQLIILNKFFDYSKPLILYSVIGFIAIFFDRWMLQFFAGSYEQAFYSISFQISAISLLATSSILKIFWKEIAESNSNQDIVYTKKLYENSCKALYLTACFIMGFIFFWVDEIILFFLGVEYLPGKITFLILLFYPVHQCLGQIVSSFLYATSETRILSYISSLFLLLGMLLTFMLIGENALLKVNLQMGSAGLAIKMVIIQFLNVNILIFILNKNYNWKYNQFYQISFVIFSLLAGLLSKELINLLFQMPDMLFIRFFISLLIYLFIFVVAIYNLPSLFSIKVSELKFINNYYRK